MWRKGARSELRGFGPRLANNVVFLLLGFVIGAMGLALAIFQGWQPIESKIHPGYRYVKVVRTCGTPGAGDCRLTERKQPSPDGESIRELSEGTSLTVVCQVTGSPVTASQLKRETKVWSQIKGGGYVSNAYLEGIDVFAVTTPCPS